MIICSSCGAQQPDGMNFCDQCGAQLPAPQPMGAGMAAPAAAPMYAAPPPAAGVTCANCQHVNPVGSAFCEECGNELAGGPGPMVPLPQQQAYPPVMQPPVMQQMPQTSLKFITPNGAQVPFPPSPTNTWIIGREDPVSGVHPEVDMTPHDPDQTISRRHAQITLQNGQPMLTSITSTNWTKLNGVRIVANQPQVIKAGDKIEFAKCAVTFGM